MNFKNIENFWSRLAIFICGLAIALVISNHGLWKPKNKIINWDVLEYYQYLPATIIFGDVTAEFLNNWETTQCCFWPLKTKINKNVFKFTMGISVMYAPFFLMAHGYSSFFDLDNLGYSPPYVFMLLVGSFFYLMIGLIFLRKILLQYFSDPVTAFTLVLLVLGTNLFCYATFKSLMSHSFSFSLIALFIYMTLKWHKKQKWSTTIGIGLCVGLISLIRPSNAIVIILFVLYGIYDLKSIKYKIELILNNIPKLIILVLMVMLVWSPQMLYWKEVSGQYMYMTYKEDENFFFNSPNILNGLFSYRNGWLLYSPILLFALVGIGMLFKNLKEWSFGILLFTALNIYIITSWWCWWYSGFGNRAFIESYAVLSIPLACFCSWIFGLKIKRLKYFLVMFFIFLITVSIIQTFQYKKGIIHFGCMTKEAYWFEFLRFDRKNELYPLLKCPDEDLAKLGKEKL